MVVNKRWLCFIGNANAASFFFLAVYEMGVTKSNHRKIPRDISF